MVSHNAAGQMLGYLYQVRYALNLLMSSDDPSYQISIEKFDDIKKYIKTYNFERCHSSIDYKRPAELYFPVMLYEAAREAA